MKSVFTLSYWRFHYVNRKLTVIFLVAAALSDLNSSDLSLFSSPLLCSLHCSALLSYLLLSSLLFCIPNTSIEIGGSAPIGQNFFQPILSHPSELCSLHCFLLPALRHQRQWLILVPCHVILLHSPASHVHVPTQDFGLLQLKKIFLCAYAAISERKNKQWRVRATLDVERSVTRWYSKLFP